MISLISKLIIQVTVIEIEYSLKVKILMSTVQKRANTSNVRWKGPTLSAMLI